MAALRALPSLPAGLALPQLAGVTQGLDPLLEFLELVLDVLDVVLGLGVLGLGVGLGMVGLAAQGLEFAFGSQF